MKRLRWILYGAVLLPIATFAAVQAHAQAAASVSLVAQLADGYGAGDVALFRVADGANACYYLELPRGEPGSLQCVAGR